MTREWQPQQLPSQWGRPALCLCRASPSPPHLLAASQLQPVRSKLLPAELGHWEQSGSWTCHPAVHKHIVRLTAHQHLPPAFVTPTEDLS